MISPIVLCGGEGARLWPVSRRDLPKQFASLIGDLSCFQQAILRLHDIEGTRRPIVVAGEAHESLVREQLKEIDVEAVIILEPEGRDSAPAVTAAAAYLLNVGEDSPALVQPADHHIPDVGLFQVMAERAACAAEKEFIVTFGIAPDSAETSYGYIHPGDALAGCTDVLAVRRFVEKPTHEKAIEYVTQGFLWNSGIFAFRPSVMLQEMRAYEPAIADAVERAVAAAQRDGDVIRLDGFSFGLSPKKSLDYAVMERTSRAAVVRATFPWSDLGAWKAIYAAHPKDQHDNVVVGKAILIGSERSFVRSTTLPLAVIGLTDVAVVAEPDGIVVCHLEASPSVKAAVDTLRARARPEALRRTSAPPHRRDFPDLETAALQLGRWLDNSALPLWWTAGADHEQGGFFELLDRDGHPICAPRRLRVQARQIYVYASAGLAGWRGPWRHAVRHGLEALDRRYKRSDGLYRTLCDDSGAPLDERSFLYDQAFVLLALATVAKAGVEPQRYENQALQLRAIIEENYARPTGGFVEQELRGSTFQSNPHMHLLEAALAWCEAGGGQIWESLAGSLVALCIEQFVDSESGMLHEFFTESGARLEGLPGRIIEPGHQFEWAWLLSRWSEMRDDRTTRSAANRLFEIGESYGIDPLRGVAIDTLLADMSVHSRQARLWPQTERLKAALALLSHVSDEEQRESLRGTALAAAEGLSHYLHTSVPGLWHDKMRADGTLVDEPSPASSLYHIVSAVNVLRTYAN